MYFITNQKFARIKYVQQDTPILVSQDSSVGIATRYGLDGPEIESRWGEIFCIPPDRPCDPHSLLHNVYGVFPGGKSAGSWR
jgi:hypothetical protein